MACFWLEPKACLRASNFGLTACSKFDLLHEKRVGIVDIFLGNNEYFRPNLHDNAHGLCKYAVRRTQIQCFSGCCFPGLCPWLIHSLSHSQMRFSSEYHFCALKASQVFRFIHWMHVRYKQTRQKIDTLPHSDDRIYDQAFCIPKISLLYLTSHR